MVTTLLLISTLSWSTFSYSFFLLQTTYSPTTTNPNRDIFTKSNQMYNTCSWIELTKNKVFQTTANDIKISQWRLVEKGEYHETLLSQLILCITKFNYKLRTKHFITTPKRDLFDKPNKKTCSRLKIPHSKYSPPFE